MEKTSPSATYSKKGDSPLRHKFGVKIANHVFAPYKMIVLIERHQKKHLGFFRNYHWTSVSSRLPGHCHARNITNKRQMSCDQENISKIARFYIRKASNFSHSTVS